MRPSAAQKPLLVGWFLRKYEKPTERLKLNKFGNIVRGKSLEQQQVEKEVRQRQLAAKLAKRHNAALKIEG